MDVIKQYDFTKNEIKQVVNAYTKTTKDYTTMMQTIKDVFKLSKIKPTNS